MATELPQIIGIVGPIRAGKTTTTRYLAERYKYIAASNSEVLKRILEGMGITPSRNNLASLGNSLFEVLGNDVIARYRLDNLSSGRIVIDGIRYVEEIQRYSSSSNFKLLAINADPTIRFERTVRETEEVKDLNITRVEFDRLTQSRSELSVPDLVSRADAIISNIGNIHDLKNKVDEILKLWTI